MVEKNVVSPLELTSADSVLRLFRAESFLAIQSRRCPIKSAPLERAICIRDSKVTETGIHNENIFVSSTVEGQAWFGKTLFVISGTAQCSAFRAMTPVKQSAQDFQAHTIFAFQKVK